MLRLSNTSKHHPFWEPEFSVWEGYKYGLEEGKEEPYGDILELEVLV